MNFMVIFVPKLVKKVVSRKKQFKDFAGLS